MVLPNKITIFAFVFAELCKIGCFNLIKSYKNNDKYYFS